MQLAASSTITSLSLGYALRGVSPSMLWTNTSLTKWEISGKLRCGYSQTVSSAITLSPEMIAQDGNMSVRCVALRFTRCNIAKIQALTNHFSTATDN